MFRLQKQISRTALIFIQYYPSRCLPMAIFPSSAETIFCILTWSFECMSATKNDQSKYKKTAGNSQLQYLSSRSAKDSLPIVVR